MERWLGELGEGTGDSGGQARLLPPPYEVREAWAAGMSPPQAALHSDVGARFGCSPGEVGAKAAPGHSGLSSGPAQPHVPAAT